MTYKHTEWLNVTYEIKYDYDDLKQLNEQLIQLPKIITSKESLCIVFVFANPHEYNFQLSIL